MQPARPLCLCLALWSLAACGGSKAKKDTEPPPPPNDPPTIQVPAGLLGAAAQFTFTLGTAGHQTLTFMATDPNGDSLLWQCAVPTAEATAAGLAFQTPMAGSTFPLDVQAVAAPAAAPVTLLVEDPHGGVAAIDLLVVRSGAPTITGVSPGSAFASRPTNLAVTGTALLLGGAVNTTVRVAGATATDVVVLDDTSLTCTTPTGTAAGPATVSVTHAYGMSTLPSTFFRLLPYPPVFAAIDQRLDMTGAAAARLALDGTAAHAVWIENGVVMHCASADAGANWGPPQSVSGAELASEPQVLVAGSDVSVLWVGDGQAIWLCRSNDSGLTFAPAQRLDAGGSPPTTVARPRFCRSGDRRYAAWISGNPGASAARIVATLSGDAGANWTAAVPVADGGANQGNHELVCDGLSAWIVCEDDREGTPARGVYVVRTINGGATWSPIFRLSQTGAPASEPRVSIDAGWVHVVWLRNGALEYNVSANGGITWGNSVTQLRDTSAGAVTAPRLCCKGSRIAAISVAGGQQIWLSRL
ncbi:MAG TPA: IPT/TIG domain-containing protein, partial [Planctomycetota bacterium]|nr:IPT/TIG domain-containing protein [Planctomycetota bacterium]